METKSIQAKFSTIYKVVNILFYFYIGSLLLGFIIFPVLLFITGFPIWEFLSDLFLGRLDIDGYIIGGFLLVAVVGLFMWFNIYLVYLLRKIARNLKNGKIFTDENAKNIRLVFQLVASILVIIGLTVSGWILSLVSATFLWILYEIFFIGFDYKLKNEKLTEENNLTI